VTALISLKATFGMLLICKRFVQSSKKKTKSNSKQLQVVSEGIYKVLTLHFFQ